MFDNVESKSLFNDIRDSGVSNERCEDLEIYSLCRIMVLKDSVTHLLIK